MANHFHNSLQSLFQSNSQIPDLIKEYIFYLVANQNKMYAHEIQQMYSHQYEYYLAEMTNHYKIKSHKDGFFIIDNDKHKLVKIALIGGHLPFLDHFRKLDLLPNYNLLMYLIIKYGNLEIFQWAIAHQLDVDTSVFHFAKILNNWVILEYIQDTKMDKENNRTHFSFALDEA
eukprot:NODE_558_length_6080_cov_0.296773.p4 type:complete len:173 gc:universal NODE_558_length_6080_cov_0.296773:4758-5276(+)